MGKKQHYVPQFYLRNFSQDGVGIDLFLLEKKQFRPSVPIKSVAYEDNLYGEDGEIEQALSEIESESARIIKLILNEPGYIFDRDNYFTLLLFIFISGQRTVKKADEIDELGNILLQKILEIEVRHGVFSNYTIQDLKDIKIHQKVPNAVAFAGLLEQIPLLLDLKYICIVNESNVGFITSDAPNVTYNQLYALRNFGENYGYANSGLQIFLPLSPQICICLYDGEAYDIPDIVYPYILEISSKSQIKKLNQLFASNAYRQIYSIKITPSYLEKITCESKKFNFAFFKIRPEYQSCELPEHLGGLIRPKVIPILEEQEKREHEN